MTNAEGRMSNEESLAGPAKSFTRQPIMRLIDRRPMTTTRIILAGVLGAIAMFIWTSIAHMFLPLGHAGVRELPNESAVLAALETNLGDKSSLYLFSGLGVGDNPTREQMNVGMKYMD